MRTFLAVSLLFALASANVAVAEPKVLGGFYWGSEEGVFQASGRWKGSIPKDHLPLGVFKLVCFKRSQFCIEGGAFSSTDYKSTITPLANPYGVVSWTSSQIVLEPSVDGCGTIQITIDLVAKRVLRTTRIKRNASTCSALDRDALKGEPDTYTLELRGDF
jgi:hypothetical protein